MIDEAALRAMSQQERDELARALAAIDLPHPMQDPVLRKRRRFGLLVTTGACLFLAGWIAVLMLNLPLHFTARHWRGTWVGLDIAELGGLAATAWAAWHQRQVAIMFMIFTATLLIGDAWFDVALDYGTPGETMSVLSAVFLELPLALLLLSAARRLVRITAGMVMRLEGLDGPVPPLWRIPLFADGLAEAIPDRLRGKVSQLPGLCRQEGHGR